MSRLRRSLEPLVRRREWGLMAAIGAVAILVSLADARFLAWQNLQDLLLRAAPTVIVACGVTLVVVTAEIDISVGSLLGFLGAVMGLMLSRDLGAWPVALAVPLILLLGTAMGLVTGSVVTYGRVPSIIATLGLLTALRGITTLLMGGQNIDNLPASLTETMKQPVAGLPVAVWTAAAVVAATSWLLHHTPLGRRLFALGSSAYSARMAGLSEHRLKLFVFAYTGLTTAIATLVDVPRLPKIEAGLGAEFELLVVTCVVVGGVSIAGGRGTLTGVVLAAILLTMVRPVLTFLDVGEAGEKWTKAIQGLFIVLAMVGDDWARRRSGSARSPGRSSSS